MSVYDEARLADAVWWLAHGDGGRALLGPRVLGLVLAGGLLAELFLTRKIDIWEDGCVISERDPPGDDLSAYVFGEIAKEPGLPIPVWLTALRRVSVEHVTHRLGLVVPAAPGWGLLSGRRRGVPTRAPTGRQADVVWASLSMQLRRHERLDLPDTVLVALATTGGLSEHLLEGALPSVYRHTQAVVSSLPEPFTVLVAEIRRAVARDALAVGG